jgi:hypothetical protein
MNIDWTRAPDWAKYHIFSMDGWGHWLSKEPNLVGNYPAWQDVGWHELSGYTMPDGMDWKKSSTKREQP